MSVYTQLQKNISDYYVVLKKQYSAKYVKEALLGAVILVALFGGYFLHSFYVNHREQRAFGALIEVVESFEKAQYAAMGTGDDTEKVKKEWEDTEILLDALYKENMGSYLAPYFLMFKSQIELEKAGNPDDARKIIIEALGNISQGSELFSLFNLKRIKLEFDSKDEKVRESAFKDLQIMAKDENSNSFEESLYLLGAYYLYQGEPDKAHASWKDLIKHADKKGLIKSPWVTQAEEKLGSLK